MFVSQATDSSMVEGDCQIQMGRFVSFLQVEYVFILFIFFFFSAINISYLQSGYSSLQYPACILLKGIAIVWYITMFCLQPYHNSWCITHCLEFFFNTCLKLWHSNERRNYRLCNQFSKKLEFTCEHFSKSR